MSKNKPRQTVAAALIQQRLQEQERLQAPYERALGKLSMEFSLLHILLEQFSWGVWNLHGPLGLILTKDLPVTHLVEKLRSSIEHVILRQDDRKAFQSILSKVGKAAKQRNELLHSLWVIRGGEPIFCFSRKRGPLVGLDAPSIQEINALTENIKDIVFEFQKFKELRRSRGLFA